MFFFLSFWDSNLSYSNLMSFNLFYIFYFLCLYIAFSSYFITGFQVTLSIYIC